MTSAIASEPAPSRAGESVPAGSRGGSWRVAIRRLRRDRAATAAFVVLVLVVLSAALAPVYAHEVAHASAYAPNVNGSIVVHGHRTPVIAPSDRLGLGESPIGPTWTRQDFLGADPLGRDLLARVLYGGRDSLLIGVSSAVLASLIALVIGLVSGFYRGVTDAVLSRLMDVIWAFPVYLLAIALATVLLLQSVRLGPIALKPTSIWTPTMVIGLIFVPYVARPIRGEVLSIREKEFVEAGIAQGASNLRLICSDVLPNVIPTLIVLLPLITALTILTESGLAYLSISVQPPAVTWGTIIADGQNVLYTRPWVSIAPGLMIAITTVALNALGDGIRGALDPKAQLRAER